jgi:hypothetical protein
MEREVIPDFLTSPMWKNLDALWTIWGSLEVSGLLIDEEEDEEEEVGPSLVRVTDRAACFSCR